MTAYEMMLSESQERMLMVLNPELEDEAKAIFDKWDLDFAIVGETIAEDRFLILHGGEAKADLPLAALAGSAPEYDRPFRAPRTPDAVRPIGEADPAEALRTLVGSPNLASRRWIWEQYDHSVLADTIRGPGAGAGLVRVHGTSKILAFTSDVTPRYVAADPRQGGRQAVAEAWRNLVSTGARPLAATDNLNFGNPEVPEIMWQLVEAIGGIGEACRALDMPIVSGNVSLYNETAGKPILPTPTIGGVGLIASADQIIPSAPNAGDAALLLGPPGAHLHQSVFAHEIAGIREGPPPPVDLEAEALHGRFLLDNRKRISAATDLSDGGLALAAFEMAIQAGIGVRLEVTGSPRLFGEDQARYLLAAAPDETEALLREADAAGVPLKCVGSFGGTSVVLGDAAVPLDELRRIWEAALPAAFG
jgi:phosphoribosylformylglycinamidine synthase